MAELINKQDSLNDGRKKLNNAITDAESAKNTAEDADTKATAALNNSESTQTQLDTIVIEGDSSVEAAQARVDADGANYDTLKDRLDTEHTQVTSQLADIAVDMTSLPRTGTEDASPYIQAIIDAAESSGITRIKLPKNTYRFDNIVTITKSNIKLDFSGSKVLNYAKSSGNTRGETGLFNVMGSFDSGVSPVSFIRGDIWSPPVGTPSLLTYEPVEEWFSNPHFIGGKIKTSDNSLFNIGDELLLLGLTRETSFPYDPTLAEPYLQRVVTVVDKDVDYLYVDYYSPFGVHNFVNNETYQSSVQKVNLVKNVTIMNVEIEEKIMFAVENSPTTTEQKEALSGVFNVLTKGLTLENVSMKRHKYSAIYTYWARDITYRNIYTENPQWWVGGKGYLTQILGSRDARLYDIHGDKNRHLIDFSYSSSGYVDNAYQTNGREADFDLHGLNEHDIHFNRVHGELYFGNNIDLFPNMMQNVTVRDSNVFLATNATANEVFVRNLFIENSKIRSNQSVIASSFVFRDCDIHLHYLGGGGLKANKRGYDFTTEGLFNNCEITFESGDLDESKRVVINGFDKLTFKNVDFKLGFDYTQFTNLPRFYLWNIKELNFENTNATQLGFEYRVVDFTDTTINLKNAVFNYLTYQGNLTVINFRQLNNVNLEVNIKDSKVDAVNSIYLWLFDNTDTSGNLMYHLSDSKFMTDAWEGFSVPTPSKMTVLTSYDGGNIIKRNEPTSLFDANRNVFYT